MNFFFINHITETFLFFLFFNFLEKGGNSLSLSGITGI